MKFSLHRTLLLLVGISLIAALLPAGVILDDRLTTEIRDNAHRDLEMAPLLLADRQRSRGDVIQMSARDLANGRSLRNAMELGRSGTARRILSTERDSSFAETILVGPEGDVLDGPAPGDSLIGRALRGGVVTEYRETEAGLRWVALAPIRAPAESVAARVERGEVSGPIGAAGVTVDVGPADAGALAGLSRADVLILTSQGALVAASGDSLEASRLAAAARDVPADGEVHTVSAAGRRWWVSAAPLDGAARVLFARRLDQELAVLPELRNAVAVAVLVALVFALGVAWLFAHQLAGPVESLASAADRMAAGDHEAPLRRSRIREVERVGDAFSGMRSALTAQMDQLATANRELEARQNRLKMLQAEMIRRDRLATSGRLVAELAHEIRNPVASIRNCLEVIRRKLVPEDQEFADLAIDELLRMHELAEQVLDLNRPIGAGDPTCDPGEVTRAMARLVHEGTGEEACRIELRQTGDPGQVAMPADALKQVVLNLVQNASEAMPSGGAIRVEINGGNDVTTLSVLDRGSGIPEEVLPSIFDPFFTTKGAVRGVGLGLFIAEGIVRRYGGSISASNRHDGGAVFKIELPRIPTAVESGV